MRPGPDKPHPKKEEPGGLLRRVPYELSLWLDYQLRCIRILVVQVPSASLSYFV
jgi:hypothetical protein